MSPLTIVGTRSLARRQRSRSRRRIRAATFRSTGQGRIVNQAPTPITPIVLMYYNLGNAKVSGVDAGLTAILTQHLEARSRSRPSRSTI